MVIGDEELDEAMMVHTRFHVRASDVSGYLVILVGVTSLDRLMFELDRWSQRQLE